MRILGITLLTLLFSSMAVADNFKLKLDISTVDHQDISGASVTIKEKGEALQSITVKDEDTKVELSKGKLYEIWIEKEGYLPHVIHNVHSEGKSKIGVVLFKPSKKLGHTQGTYRGANRTFLDVKKMTIPAEYLADGVLVISEESLSKNEVSDLKAVNKLGKSQLKAQKKIDGLDKKRSKVESEMTKVKSEVENGKTAKTDGDADLLKLQKELVKLNGKIEKLSY